MNITDLKNIDDIWNKHVSSMRNRLRNRRTITEEEFASYVEEGEICYDTLHQYYLSIAAGEKQKEPLSTNTQAGDRQTTGQGSEQADGDRPRPAKANTTTASKRKSTK